MPKFYQTPKGTLSTSEKQWKDDMRAEGFDPKAHEGRNTFIIPTKAAELMEFLTFHNVNVVNPRGAAPATEITGAPASDPPCGAPVVTSGDAGVSLDELFEAAPLRARLRLAVCAIDAADKALYPTSRI